MRMVYRSEGFKEWVDLIENLTVGWMLENYVSSHRRRQKLTGIVRISTYTGILEIQWEDIVYAFSFPTMDQFELTMAEDKILVRYLSTNVLSDFNRILEL